MKDKEQLNNGEDTESVESILRELGLPVEKEIDMVTPFKQFCEQSDLKSDDPDLEKKIRQYCEKQAPSEYGEYFLTEIANDSPIHGVLEYVLFKDKVRMVTITNHIAMSKPLEQIINLSLIGLTHPKWHASELCIEKVGESVYVRILPEEREKTDFPLPPHLFDGFIECFEELGYPAEQGNRTIPIRAWGVNYNLIYSRDKREKPNRITLRLARLEG